MAENTTGMGGLAMKTEALLTPHMLASLKCKKKEMTIVTPKHPRNIGFWVAVATLEASDDLLW